MRLPRILALVLSLCTLYARERPLSVIAFGSCAEQNRPQPIWKAVLAQKPQLFLFLGDNIYSDTQDMAQMAGEYVKLAQVPGFRRLRAAMPVMATWDDHDYGGNDAGRDYPKRDESRALFLDFWGDPADAPRRKHPGVYDARIFGPPGRAVQVILLDTRYFRSPLKPRPGGEDPLLGRWSRDEGPGADMLGSDQWAWLEEQLRKPADLRLLVSSVQVVADDHGWEKWGNLPRERQRLFDLLKETGAEGILILSGDRHFGDLNVMDAGLGYPLYDFTSSGLNQGGHSFRYRPGGPTRVAMQARGDNFGLLRIDWNAPDPKLWLECRDEAGQVRFAEAVPLNLLKRKPAPAAPAAAPPERPPASAAGASPR